MVDCNLRIFLKPYYRSRRRGPSSQSAGLQIIFLNLKINNASNKPFYYSKRVFIHIEYSRGTDVCMPTRNKCIRLHSAGIYFEHHGRLPGSNEYTLNANKYICPSQRFAAIGICIHLEIAMYLSVLELYSFGLGSAGDYISSGNEYLSLCARMACFLSREYYVRISSNNSYLFLANK